MTDISQALVDKMVALVRTMSATLNDDGTVNLYGLRTRHEEAARIAAELPAPVDPDLLLAREVAALELVEAPHQSAEFLNRIWEGDADHCSGVRIAYAAIKHVRAEYAAAGDVIAS